MKLYLAAFGVVATILSLKLTLPDGFLTLDTPLLLLIVTVAICSWRSGVRIGAFTTLICSVIAIFAFWQEGGPNTDLRLALFAVLGVLIGVMAETVRADQIRNDKEKSDLEDQVRKEQRKIEMLEANER